MSNINNVDLNLLTAFDLLMTCGSVSKAAQKLGITQSAMSHILKRLRVQFDDPLLIKKGKGMVPTNRAKELFDSIHKPLLKLQSAMEPQLSFVPKSSSQTFNFATTDYFELMAFPYLFQALSKQAPKVKIRCRNMEDHELSEIGTSFDLAFGHFKKAPESLHRKKLWHEKFVTIAAKKHPRIKRSLRLDNFLQENHILISPSGYGRSLVDKQLQLMGHKRHISLYTSHFTTPIHTVVQSQLLATVPQRLVKGFETDLKIFEPPVAIPGFDIHMLWSPLSHNDPAQRWMRNIIQESVSQV
ncbi:MAG: LysR family transcriptional regulator [Kangiellaceae bacterium]|nr:LysR family transcriptional regulator [Kangiellaceae bacterium]MCW9015547.1 LysR family transcriptional regulator [Kangiellaceae bacterium]